MFIKKLNKHHLISHLFLIVIGIIMIYPLIWLFFAAFKDNIEIHSGINLLPKQFNPSGFIKGWKWAGNFTFGYFIINTFKLVLPTVIATVASSTLVAYGFARFSFPFKRILFIIMISTMMLPNAVIIIPRYILFNKFGWLNTYKPFYIPQLFAFAAFFNFMLIQFFRGIPKELDESALIDGCGSFVILTRILLPLCVPAILSVALFQFMWTWNDFFNSLIYINSVAKYPVSIALSMGLDNEALVEWNKILAMSFVGILPPAILFFLMQKYFVEGISTSGVKG
ncbi:carbohydrate ABC transporter permease [bacterium]|nr:carbohydrate ABC transporter permease [bacterium]